MKKLSGAKVAFVMFSAMTVACVSGSIGGTLAWYAYSTRALVSYSGTSVSETALLQIGICSDVELDNMPDSITDVSFGDGKHYYFAAPGQGMTYDIIAKYLTEKHFATNVLEPLTSGSFATGQDESDFSLKQSPNELVHGNTIEGEKRNYLTIPFVFRIQGENPTDFYDNKELWLSKAVARASSSGGDVYKAIRVFVDRDERNYDEGDFILNPSAASKGKTRVGGVMNKSRDGCYDFDSHGEILYGEYDPAALNLISNAPYAGNPDTVYDVNGVGDLTPSTFVAKHKTNTKYYSNLAAHDELFGHAEYESISSIAPKRDNRDYLTNHNADHPTSVCKTRADDNHLARVNLTVYLEGWDFSVVDKERTHGFDLGLTFEMSRL